MVMNLYFCVPFLTLLVFISVDALQCVDENNKNVDWYYMYKIPHQRKNSTNKLVKEGVAYLYITSADSNLWKLSEFSVKDSNSMLSRTLAPLYDKTKNSCLVHVLYNDEPPNKAPKARKGHTKGVVLGDSNGGVWVVHSVPLYPPAMTEPYIYPQTGTVYGQSVLCISFDQNNFDNIGIQLLYNQPEIYSSNLPEELSGQYSNIRRVINNDLIDNPPWFHSTNLKSKDGTNFLSFAKTRDFSKDIYEDWVAPALNTSLFVETWLNGPGKLASNCSKPFSVNNIATINLKLANFTFKSALDHSKWAVSSTNSSNWLCVGDINRAEHQEHRGGGTVCINSPKIANAYRGIITSIENCPKK